MVIDILQTGTVINENIGDGGRGWGELEKGTKPEMEDCWPADLRTSHCGYSSNQERFLLYYGNKC